jgi:hypothetical protein
VRLYDSNFGCRSCGDQLNAMPNDIIFFGKVMIGEERVCLPNLNVEAELPLWVQESVTEVNVVYSYVEGVSAWTIANKFVHDIVPVVENVDPGSSVFDLRVTARVAYPYEIKRVRVLARIMTDDASQVYYYMNSYTDTGTTMSPVSRSDYQGQQTLYTRNVGPATLNVTPEPGYIKCTSVANDGLRQSFTDLNRPSSLDATLSWTCEQTVFFQQAAAPCDSTFEFVILAEIGCQATTGCSEASIKAQYKSVPNDLPSWMYADFAFNSGLPVENLPDFANEILLGHGQSDPVECPDAFAVPVVAELRLASQTVIFVPESTVAFTFTLRTFEDVLDDYRISFCYARCGALGAVVQFDCLKDLAPLYVDAVEVGNSWADVPFKFSSEGITPPSSSQSIELTVPSTADLGSLFSVADMADSVSCTLYMGAELDGNVARRHLTEYEVFPTGIRGRKVLAQKMLAPTDTPAHVHASVSFAMLTTTQIDVGDSSGCLSTARFFVLCTSTVFFSTAAMLLHRLF